MAFTVLAPAKVNLYLRVLRKRPDGFHDIETLFERIALFDELVFEKLPSGIQLRCEGRDGINVSRLRTGRGNLVWRAADLLKRTYGVEEGVSIRLKKMIPIAAGLGGGSSDAAATLLGLNRLWRLGLPRKKLIRHAATLGSDVPFFLLRRSFAWGRGRGELLEAVRSQKKLWHIIVVPPFELLTRKVYGALKPSDLTAPAADARLVFGTYCLFNMLERAIFKKRKDLAGLKLKLLAAGARGALVSGTGPTVFGLAGSKDHAMKIARRIRKETPYPVKVISTY